MSLLPESKTALRCHEMYRALRPNGFGAGKKNASARTAYDYTLKKQKAAFRALWIVLLVKLSKVIKGLKSKN